MSFWLYFGLGLASGLILTPVYLYFHYKFKMRKILKETEKLIANGEFLKPLDTRDYDSQKWADKLDISKLTEELSQLNSKIFTKKYV